MIHARSPRLRHRLSAAVVVIAIGAAIWCVRDRRSAPDRDMAAKRTKQAEKGAVAVVPLHVDHLDDERVNRPHPLDVLHAGLPRTAGTAEPRWAPFGSISEEEEASRLQQREVSPAVQNLPAGAIEHIVAELENELQEKGGRYGYNSRHYGATLEAGWVELATNHQFRIGAPTLSYALETVKVGDQVVAWGGPAEPVAKAEQRTVGYARGPVDEEYTLRSEAMEQTFVVKELPASRGAITVTGIVSTNLSAPADGAKGAKLGFTYKGKELITLSEAVAIDAAGRKLPLELEWSGGRLAMTVPADWVASATLPIRIDPLVGSAFSVFSTTDPNTNYTVGNAWPVRMVDAAYSPTNGTWFVVWTQRWGTGGSNGFDYDVRGQRVSATGTLVGGVVGIDTSTGGAYEPSISYSSGSSFDRYLIAYRFDPSNNLSDTDQRIQGKIHGGDGVFVTLNPFTIEDPAGQDMAPTSAFDGTNWYVSYTNKVSSSNYDVRGRFVSTAGTPGTSASPDTATGDSAYMSSVSYANGAYMIVWTKGTTSSGTISARTMLPSGSFPTAITTVEPSTNGPREADVSGGGTKFLIVWRNNSNQSISGRTADAGTGSTITFPTSTFTIQTSSASQRSTPRAAYSATSDAWYAVWADAATNGTDIYGARVSSAGVVSPVEQISSDASWEWRPELAWNSATNEMLLLYNFGSGSPSFAVKAQRYSMASGGSPPPAPANFRGTAQATNSLLWEWDNVAGETGFEVRDAGQAVKGTVGVDVLGFTETVGLTENNSYSRHVNATSGSGPSPDSNVAAKYTKVHDPLAGDFTVTAASSSQINVVVTAPPNSASGSTGCEIDRSPDGSTGWVTVRAFSAVYTFGDTGLTPNTAYFYRFRFRNGDAVVTAYSPVKSAVTLPLPPAAPTGLAAAPGNAQVVLTWSASAGATSYKVFRSTTSGSYGSPIATGVAGSPFTDSGLTNGTTYFYVVKASNAGGDSGNSNEASATPVAPPAAPTGLAATPGNAQVSLTWTASAGATSYNVKRGTSNGGPYPTVFSGITLTSFTDTGLSNGTTYYYVVTALNVGGESGNSNQSSATPTGSSSAPPAPTGLSAVAGVQSVALSWNASTGATGYHVKRGTFPGNEATVGTVNAPATTFSDAGLINGATYSYVVTAFNSAGESGPSNEVLVVPDAVPPSPFGLTATSGNTQVSLSWGVPGDLKLAGFNVYRSASSGGPFGPAQKVNPSLLAGPTFTDTGLTNGSSYFYVVRSVNASSQESGNSNTASAVPSAAVPLAPTGLAAGAGNAQVTLTWSASAGATGYTVLRGLQPGGAYAPVATVSSGLTFTDTALTNQTTYYYVLTAQNSSGQSANSAEAQATPSAGPVPAAPTGLSATPLNTRVQLSWSAVSGATGYLVYRSESSTGGFEQIADVTTSPITDGAELVNGTTYYYVVQAYNANGLGPRSAPAAATPAAPSSSQVLFIVGNTTLNTGDAAIVSSLQAAGYAPVVEQDSVAVASDATGKTLVVISATASSANVGSNFAAVSVPILNLQAAYYGPLGMTGGSSGTSPGQIQVSMVAANAFHPMAAGLTGLVNVVGASDTFTWGVPGASAVSIATLASDSGKPVIFGYESGAALVSGTAPARRVGFFLTGTTAANLNANGSALWTAAVAWAAGAPQAPSGLVVQNVNGSASLKWEGSSTALTYRVLRSTSPGGPFSVIASGISGTAYFDAGVLPNLTYYYVVQALTDAGGISAFSVAASVLTTPAGPHLVIGVIGPRHIHTLRPAPYVFDPVWDQGDYYLVVYLADGHTYTPATVTSASWSFGVSSSRLTMITDPADPGHMTLRASSAQSNIDDTARDLIDVTGVTVAGSAQTTDYFFWVETSNRGYLQVLFRFPQAAGSGAPGQTTRRWGSGNPNNFFSTTDNSLRAQDRNDFSVDLADKTSAILAQAGIKLYATVNPNLLNFDAGMFDALGRFLEEDANGNDSNGLNKLFNNFDLPGVGTHNTINIYLVHRIWSPVSGGSKGLTTHQAAGGYGTTILLSDTAEHGAVDAAGTFQEGQNPEATLAHEITHSLNLRHITNLSRLTGALNNLRWVTDDGTLEDGAPTDVPPIPPNPTDPRNPANWNLMREFPDGRRTDFRGHLLHTDQVNYMRSSLLNHPARGSDHGPAD